MVITASGVIRSVSSGKMPEEKNIFKKLITFCTSIHIKSDFLKGSRK